MSDQKYDLCVIGGGINGAGVARDAAGRGLSVLLLEAQDLAQATSSASTKLIHGGLRYLEFYEFKLVRESLQERERLLNIAPHIIWPMEFVLPHTPEQRPFWMIRLGLFLYDHLAKRVKLKGSRGMDLVGGIYGAPLIENFDKGFMYSDCWVEDSRLVVLNAMDAKERGAQILTRAKCEKLQHKGDHWRVSYRHEKAKKPKHIKARMVVNAAGPWVRTVIDDSGLADGAEFVPNVRLVKGSHIILPRRYKGEHAYILQQKDKRIVFAIPYEKHYTLVGTTEESFEGNAYDPRISDEEMAYLIDAFNGHFKDQITKKDVLWSYSGVRPLFDDGDDHNRKVTRDFVLHHHTEFTAPMISVFGGKLTTYRVLAEQAVARLLNLENNVKPSWSADKPLPGGDFRGGNFKTFLVDKAKAYPWLDEALLLRYARAYGSRMDMFLKGAQDTDDLGAHYGDDVYEAEILYLIAYEFARTTEDILFRRSKLGLHVEEGTMDALEAALPALLKEVKKG